MVLMVAALTSWVYAEAKEITQRASLPSGSDALAVAVFSKLAKQEKGNVVYSPASAEKLLHTLITGAVGSTRRELEALPYGQQGVASAMKLLSADALFAADDLALKPTAHELHRVPFRTDAAAAAAAINAWCSEHTKGKIDQMVSQRDISAQTRLIALNAIYLKENWLRPFDKQDTKEQGEFHLLSGKTVQTAMMSRQGSFRYAEGEGWRAVALFYERQQRVGEPGCFIAILPKGDARAFAAKLTTEKFHQIRLALAQASDQRLKVILPRFEVKTNIFTLRPALEALGLKRPFSLSADFSDFADEPMHLDDVRQKCYVKVDEQGTEAAAVTVGMVRAVGIAPPTPVLCFDRPFIWVIGDISSAAPPFFMGLLEKP